MMTLKIEFGGADSLHDGDDRPYALSWLEFSVNVDSRTFVIERWFSSGERGGRGQLQSVLTCRRKLGLLAEEMGYAVVDDYFQSDCKNRFYDLLATTQPVPI